MTYGFLGKTHTEETKKKISIAKKGKKKFTEEEAHQRKIESTRNWRKTAIGKTLVRARNNKPENRVKAKEWQKSDRGKAFRKKHRVAIRRKVLEAYGGENPKCVCCGEEREEFLSFDHINGGGGKHLREIGGHLANWLVKNNYPKGFRILCHNCNFSKGKYGYCPHHNLPEDNYAQ